ncbi:MAG: FadR/GntR family transcriptional regulator [Deltaproteobacteria bacterium]|nr:FadR/GntR family transcriptional regulator [Deltaproteobacteria bacterium]
MPLQPITKTRISEAAIEQIKELIVSENLEPGAKLPSERELVEALGVGRSSIREALRILEIMGLVEVQPGKGAFVKALTGDLFIPLSELVSAQKETLHHHFEARMVLEPAAAALAAKRASPQEVDRLRKNLKSFQNNLARKNLVGIIRADIEFHRLVANATENRTIVVVMNTITRYDIQGWKAALRTSKRPQKTIAEHGKVIEAIAEGDEKKARSAMRSHLLAAQRNLGLVGA